MKDFVLVFLGSGLGGCLRYGISMMMKAGTSPGRFPLATFLSNTLACLLAAWILTRILPSDNPDSAFRLLLLTGFCGGFSTFSALSLETVSLIKCGNWIIALLYAVLSFGTGLAAFLIFEPASLKPGG